MKVDILTGTVRAEDERACDLSPRRLALLVALARRRGGFARSCIIEELWPEQDAEAGVNAFNVCLFHARRLLGEKSIVQERGAYRLGDGARVDLWDIEEFACDVRARACLCAKEQDALCAAADRLAAARPAFYADWHWFEGTERRIERLLMEIAQRSAREALHEGRAFDALTSARALIERDPCDEPAHEIAIRAHLALGDEAAAFQKYRRYREAVFRELGATPSRSFEQMAIEEKERGAVLAGKSR